MTRVRKAVVYLRQDIANAMRAEARHTPAQAGLRAQYPNATVDDAMTFTDFMSATEIAKRLGAPMKEVQAGLRFLEKRGHLVTQGRRYRLG